MSKTELVEYIASKTKLTKADATRALDATLEGMFDMYNIVNSVFPVNKKWPRYFTQPSLIIIRRLWKN